MRIPPSSIVARCKSPLLARPPPLSFHHQHHRAPTRPPLIPPTNPSTSTSPPPHQLRTPPILPTNPWGQSKLATTIATTFSVEYALQWPQFFPGQPLTRPFPTFDGRTVLYPKLRNLRDYLSWRQADCESDFSFSFMVVWVTRRWGRWEAPGGMGWQRRQEIGRREDGIGWDGVGT